MRIRAVGLWMGLSVALGCGSQDAGLSNPTTLGGGQNTGALFNNTQTQSGPCAPNPANFEVPGNQCDDDADGQVDNVPNCDTNMPVDGTAAHFARALGICQMADQTRWGLVGASYAASYGVDAPPNPYQHGILPKFGASLRPREGGSMGVLSSGYAREYNGAPGAPFQNGQVMTGPGRVPTGYPRPAAGCQIDTSVNDVVTVKLKIKTPANAKGVAFDFNFYSGEWPEWVCSRYNDAFIAFLTSKGFNNGAPENISFDAQKNPVSVNNGFFDRCTPGTMTGCSGEPPVIKTSICPGGEAELAGTGFETRDRYCGSMPSTGGGATGWLTSTAPVLPNEEITLEFMIWDTGDDNYDSSVLLDNLRWEVGATQTVTSRPK
jgi:hypothetical protein